MLEISRSVTTCLTLQLVVATETLGIFLEHGNKYREAINNDNKLESNSESTIFLISAHLK